MKKIIFIILSLCSLVIAQDTPKDTISLKTIDGKSINLKITDSGFIFKEYKNKVVLLDIFGTECPYCIRSRETLVNLQNRYKNNLQIIAIQVQNFIKDDTLKQFAKKYNMTYPIVNLQDAQELVLFIQVNANWQGQIPYMMLFDKKGNMKKDYLGLSDEKQLEFDIKSSI